MDGIVGRKLVLPEYGNENQYLEISVVNGNPNERYPEISKKWQENGGPSIDGISVRKSCGVVFNLVDYGLGELIDQHVGHSHMPSGRTIGDILEEAGLQTEYERKGFKSEDEFLLSKIN